MNPCCCGFYPDKRRCSCTPQQIKNYIGKISRPIIDRIDICTDTVALKYDDVKQDADFEDEYSSDNMRKRIIRAQQLQFDRYKNEKILFYF